MEALASDHCRALEAGPRISTVMCFSMLTMAFSMPADPALGMRSLLQLDWIDWNGSREHGVEI